MVAEVATRPKRLAYVAIDIRKDFYKPNTDIPLFGQSFRMGYRAVASITPSASFSVANKVFAQGIGTLLSTTHIPFEFVELPVPT